jgi:predicted alpha/beta-fold hydrolase
MFLETMKPAAIIKHAQYPGLFDLKRALAARTLYEFDDAFTSVLHGFAGVEDYWRRASSKPWLVHIECPALILHARNDPFVPTQAWASQQEVSQSVHVWQSETGGHVGFTSGAFAGNVLAMPQAVTQWLAEA